MNIRVYLVDDELPARKYLRQLLGEFQDVEIAGESSNAVTAFQEIMSLNPDILFLDIQMPGLSGVDLTKMLAELPESPLIIFTTAYSQFAVDAFNLQAVDYLLKPFDSTRLAQAIGRAQKQLRDCRREELSSSDSETSQSNSTKPLEFITATQEGRMFLISPSSIVFAKCIDSITFIYANELEYRISLSLTSFYNQMKDLNFFRTHRNTVVNLNFVREIHNDFNGCCKLIMNDAAANEIGVSRRKTRELKKRLSLHK